MNPQILELHRQGLTASDIALALDYPQDVVESYLQTPEAFKGVPSDDLRQGFRSIAPRLVERAKELLESENDGVAAKMLFYLADVNLGLKEPPKPVTNHTNVLVITERLERIRERIAEKYEKALA